MKRLAIFFVVWMSWVFSAPSALRAQESAGEPAATINRSVPDTAWQRLTKPPAFSYRNLREGYKPPKPPKPPKPYKPSVIERIIFGIIRFFGTVLGQVILWGVLIGALVYGVWMAFFSGGRFSLGRKKSITPEEDPTVEDLHGTSWLRMMEEAMSAGDTRLAVRYGYLHVLQALSNADRIAYLPGKTNADYAAELTGGAIGSDFRALSRTYEYTWYGSYPITADTFANYRERMAAVENRTRA